MKRKRDALLQRVVVALEVLAAIELGREERLVLQTQALTQAAATRAATGTTERTGNYL